MDASSCIKSLAQTTFWCQYWIKHTQNASVLPEIVNSLEAGLVTCVQFYLL